MLSYLYLCGQNVKKQQPEMNKIVRKEQFSEKVFLFEIEAPLIAKSRKAGNFVIVRVDRKGERMPLTIAAADVERGTITLVVQMVGLSSKKLCELNVGDSVADVVRFFSFRKARPVPMESTSLV